MNKKKMMEFYKDKKVLITGHTGFKGSWMCEVLLELGADVTGYSLNPPTTPAFFDMLGLSDKIDSVIHDIRDLKSLQKVFERVKPEIVFHLAAQPIVRESYKNPVDTYATNVMGTVNVLECIRNTDSVKSFINVTTDKVYMNKEWLWGYRENEELNGYDPYSNSKSCSELVTDSYRKSFFNDREIAISTCRAGNVIGGGDFAEDRIIPDCIRAIYKNEDIRVRNPYSTRPYQHVLEPVMTYLWLAMEQLGCSQISGAYNIGPEEADCVTTGELVDLFCRKWCDCTGKKIKWVNMSSVGPHEANFLKLDCSKLKTTLGWKPNWTLDEAMTKLTQWYAAWMNGEDVVACTNNQIEDFLGKWNNISHV